MASASGTASCASSGGVHSSALEPPVPRWSTRTTWRCLRTAENAGSSCGHTCTADWPGPPARKNTGSSLAEPSSVAGNQARLRVIVRLAGSVRFSGTWKLAHWACTLRAVQPLARVQGSKAMSP